MDVGASILKISSARYLGRKKKFPELITRSPPPLTRGA